MRATWFFCFVLFRTVRPKLSTVSQTSRSETLFFSLSSDHDHQKHEYVKILQMKVHLVSFLQHFDTLALSSNPGNCNNELRHIKQGLRLWVLCHKYLRIVHLSLAISKSVLQCLHTLQTHVQICQVYHVFLTAPVRPTSANSKAYEFSNVVTK